ncbi:hypothetical protein Tco_0207668, partial [Tanacetum coccineum]
MRWLDLVWKFLASDEFSRVQGELLSLAASVGFERSLSMHRTKDEFAVLKPEKLVHLANVPIPRGTRVSPPIAKESTMTHVSESLELSANVNFTASAVAFERNEEMGISVAPDDVTELVEVGSRRVPS